MKRLFSPCTRFHDIIESQGRLDGDVFQELDLDISTEEFLSAERAFTFTDLHVLLGNEDTIAWLTPHAYVVRRQARSWGQSYRLCFNADDKGIVALARSPEHLLEICDIVFRLLAASVIHSVFLNKGISRDVALIHAPALAYLLEHCQSLKYLALTDLTLDDNHCRVLGGYSRPDIDIVLTGCELTNAGTSALVEVLLRNQGPTKLYYCATDSSVLADGLRGNTRLKNFAPRISSNLEVGNRELLAIADALRENKGLVDLDLNDGCFSKHIETWGTICDSLETHPTLEVLNLNSALTDATMVPAVITSRIQALLDMVKMNLSIHTIHLDDLYSKHELFRRSVIPYLETNRLRPRLLAIQKARPFPYRVKVLGRALLSVRTDVNSFWMLLSGNAEVVLPSTAATTTLAANLPTAATTAATGATTVTASVVSTLTTTATACLPVDAKAAATSAATPSTVSGAAGPTVAAAAANVATSSADLKSKARS